VARALESVRSILEKELGAEATHICHTRGSVSLSGRILPYAWTWLANLPTCELRAIYLAQLYEVLLRYNWRI
jgi:hypothetical protein